MFTFHKLPSLRPAAWFLLGFNTEVKLDELREGIEDTGTGVCGSGGIPEARVEEIMLQEEGICLL